MIRSEDIDIRDGKYGTWTKSEDDSKFSPIGREFYIDLIERNFEDDSLYLTFKSYYYGTEIRHSIPRCKINNDGLNELLTDGFDVKNLDVFQALVPYLEDLYFKEEKEHSFHKGVGWNKLETSHQKESFPDKEYVYKSYSHIDDVQSRYDGLFDIKPRGTYEEQLDFIQKEVQGNTACELALSLGLSAVVNGRIRDIAHTPNLIVHLYGDSSRGKTTAAQLAISVAGIPDLQKTSLMMSWNSTYAAMITRLMMNRGMPVAMDEVSKYLGNDLTTLIYSLSDGRDKDRLNKNATLKSTNKKDSFATTIISTGEATITGKCKRNTGIKARVIEIDTQFTNSAEHADIIKKGCFENCGHLAPKLAEYMQTVGIDFIIEEFKHWKKLYLEKTTVETLKERVGANYAIILLSAELANLAFGFTFDVDKILDLLVDNEKENSVERNIALEAHEKLIEYARSNRGHFLRYSRAKGSIPYMEGGVNDNMEIYGRINECINKKYDDTRTILNEYCFIGEAFKKIVAKLGYEDVAVLLKKLKQAELLNHESGKLYRKRKLFENDNTTTKMYVLYEFEYNSTEFKETDDIKTPFEKQGISL